MNRKHVLWKLFVSTLYLSAFTFGGGYVIVTLMKEKFVDELHWMEEDEMLDLIAIAQSAPGAIAVNGAIVVGYKLAGLIGALVAILRLGKSKVLRAVATVYTEVIRDTPLLLQLYFFYFLLPDILPALKLSKFACITIALVINSGAYMSEVFRSGIQSIDRGQTEAARSLGLSARQTMMRIILPQAFKNVLPAMCNEFVAVTKETSLASTFYVGDLMTQYQTISGKTYLVIEPLVIIGVIYFVVTFSMSKLITVLERRLKNDD